MANTDVTLRAILAEEYEKADLHYQAAMVRGEELGTDRHEEVTAIILAAMRRAGALSREWMPIEGAPKDGREILMHYGLGDGDVPPPVVVAYEAAGRGWYCACCGTPVLTSPTHWTPLPAPPVQGLN